VGVYLFIIFTSIYFTIRQERIKGDIEKAIEIGQAQKNFINTRLKKEYKRDFETLKREAGSIGESINKIKKIIENLF